MVSNESNKRLARSLYSYARTRAPHNSPPMVIFHCSRYLLYIELYEPNHEQNSETPYPCLAANYFPQIFSSLTFSFRDETRVSDNFVALPITFNRVYNCIIRGYPCRALEEERCVTGGGEQGSDPNQLSVNCANKPCSFRNPLLRGKIHPSHPMNNRSLKRGGQHSNDRKQTFDPPFKPFLSVRSTLYNLRKQSFFLFVSSFTEKYPVSTSLSWTLENSEKRNDGKK